jgi:cupin fold WbuC family metalloprotein
MTSRRGGPDAFYSGESLPVVGRDDMESLKLEIPRTTFGRTRLCVHRDVGDSLQEMFIVLSRQTYIRPHKHVGKEESLLVLEGLVDAVFFEDDGGIARVVRMGEYGSGHQFFYRIGEGIYHTLVIHTEMLVYKEATLGPFDPAKTLFAPWAPDGRDAGAAHSYVADLAARLKRGVS